MSQVRQLAAIMFTDIVGYTALMGEDEKEAFELLNKNRELHRPSIENFGGKWIKEIGDSVLASFSAVTDAVSCAGRISQLSESIPGLKLRIGIHLGEVVFENNDVFGDGVNIASRLQSIATAGEIYISGAVYDNIANKKGFVTRFLREESLKNVKDPLRIYEVKIIAPDEKEIGRPPAHRLMVKTAPAKSIAVLPFVNMSNDPEQEYFSDGIAEEILNSLAQVKDLKVAGRTSSFQFKGKNLDLREVGEKLNVGTVLEGSVRKQGNRLRITAQLVNVVDGYRLWSDKYDREMDDIFAIQDEIAIAIAEEMKITLLEHEKAMIRKNPTEDHIAYDLYLQGRFSLNKRGSGVRQALEFFQMAAEKDPAFALAYAGMADVYCILALYSMIPAHYGMPRARDHAEKALLLNPGLVEAHTALAFINTFYDWNWAEAKKRFTHVFDTYSGYAPAHYWYSYYLSFVEKKYDAAISEARKAELLEPLVPVPFHIASMMLLNAHKFEEALQSSQAAIDLDPHFSPAFKSLGLSYAGLKKYPEAIEALETSVTLSARQPLPLVDLCWVYFLAGKTEEIQRIHEEFMRRLPTEYISSMFLACVAYFSGNEELAVEHMIKAYEQRDSTFACINVYALFSFIREDARFQPYIQKMNFPVPD